MTLLDPDPLVMTLLLHSQESVESSLNIYGTCLMRQTQEYNKIHPALESREVPKCSGQRRGKSEAEDFSSRI